jgi:hypothetical protein
MDSRVQIHALRRAAKILGGSPQLRGYLKVSALCLGLWMSGSSAAPPEVFSKVVDLILEQDLSELRTKRGGPS